MAKTSSLAGPQSPQPLVQPNAAPSTRWRVDRRVLAWTIVALIVAVPSAILWHRFQSHRQATALLDRALELEAVGNWSAAANRLHHYVQLAPRDADARVRLALAFDRAAQTQADRYRTLELLSMARTVAPDRVDVGRRQAELLLDLDDHAAALARADELLRRDPDDPVAWRVRARALAARRDRSSSSLPAETAAAFARAVELNPADVPLAVEWAVLLRLSDEPAADAAIDAMVAANAPRIEAHLARYEYRRRFGLDDADASLEQAMSLDPQQRDPRVQLAAGQRSLAAGRYDEAQACFDRVIELNPRSREGYLGSGRTYAAQGDRARALEVWRRGLMQADQADVSLHIEFVQGLVANGQPVEALAALATLEEQVRSRLVELPMGQRVQLQGLIDFWYAQAHIALGDMAPATRRLEGALKAQQGATNREQLLRFAQIRLQLGECYAACGQWEQAAASYERAAELVPTQAAPRYAAALAWERAGQTARAIAAFQQVLLCSEPPADTRLRLAQLMLRQQMALPGERRRWEPLEGLLAEAQASEPENWQVRLLTAQIAAGTGRRDEALAALEQLAPVVPLPEALIEPLALTYERLGEAAAADEVVATALAQDQRPAADLARAALAYVRGQPGPADAALVEALDHVAPERHAELRLRRVLLLLARGEAEQAWAELRRAVPPGAPRDQVLFAAAMPLELEAWDELTYWEQRLHEAEGPQGTHWKLYRALRLIEQAASAAERPPAEAAELVDAVLASRPAWGLAQLAQARLAALAGRNDEAIDAYQRAISWGQKHPRVFMALIDLLRSQQRMREADEYLAQWRSATEAAASPLDQTAALLAAGQVEEALARAEDTVRRIPDDAAAQLAFGRALLAAGRDAEAVAAFRTASQLAPDDATAWYALVAALVRTGDVAAARDALTALQEQAQLSDAARPFVLAQAWELVGDFEQARSQYEAALEADPENPQVWQRAAGFFASDDPLRAIDCLRRTLQLKPDSIAARRMLTAQLLAAGSEAELSEARRLLDDLERDGALELADQRLIALWLLRRGGAEDRRRSLQIFEAIVADPQLAMPGDRLMLADLYERDGRPSEAEEQLRAVVERDQPSAAQLARYVQHLVRYQQAERAEPWLARLEELEPLESHGRTLELRARWLAATGRSVEIAPAIEAFVAGQLPRRSDRREQARLLFELADLCTQLDETATAEKLLRQAQPLVPMGYQQLAVWLAGQERMSEAIDWCLEASGRDGGADAAIALSTVLSLGTVDPADRRRAEPVLADALQRHDTNADVLFCIGTWRLVDGLEDEALALFRRALELNPTHVAAMNNLALLLAEQEAGRSEALAHIDRAIAIAGRQPELLDTRGWVLLLAGAADEAEALFREAAAVPPADPRYRFHLAVAQWRQDRQQEARSELAAALAARLNVDSLSPSEREALRQLQTATR